MDWLAPLFYIYKINTADTLSRDLPAKKTKKSKKSKKITPFFFLAGKESMREHNAW